MLHPPGTPLSDHLHATLRARDSKIYDIRLKSYRSALEEFQPSWDGIARRSRGHVSAGEYAARDLDDLNARYEWLVDALLQRIDQLHRLVDDEVIIIIRPHYASVRLLFAEPDAIYHGASHRNEQTMSRQ